MIPDAYPTPDPARRNPGLQLPGMETDRARWSPTGWQTPAGTPARILWPSEHPAVENTEPAVPAGRYPSERSILADAIVAAGALASCRIGHRQRMGRS